MHDVCIEWFDPDVQDTTTYNISLRSELFTRKSSEDPTAQKLWFYRGLILIVPHNLHEDEPDQPGDYDIDVVVNLPAGSVMLNALRDLLGVNIYGNLLLYSRHPETHNGPFEFQIDDGEHRAIIQQLEDDLANPVD